MTMNAFALVLEDDKTLANALGRVVTSLGYDVGIAGSIAEAREQIEERPPTIMLVDVNLPDGDGLELMAELQQSIRPNFVVITGDSSQQVAVKCIRARAFDMLSKPIKLADLKETVTRAFNAREGESLSDKSANASEAGRIDSSTITIGESPASRDLRAKIAHGAAMDPCLIMIEGETGVEKNDVAEAIHFASRRRGRLVIVNCAGERDASSHNRFFGLDKEGESEPNHVGYVEQAAGGTLVLDDVTELSRELQARLLAFIDTGQFLRTNGVQPVKARVGLIGIARSRLSDALESGHLREDFYYRLAQYNIAVPRIQQRLEDKIAIAEHLLADINERNGTRKDLSENAKAIIDAYTWPGNVREMKNVLHRACIESDRSDKITLKDLEAQSGINPGSQQIGEFVGMTFWEIEKELLYATLDHHGGDKDKTAKTLGISLKTLYNRLHAYS